MDELKTLGRYQIQGVLGKGAMGLVYDGLDPNLNRRVAIKTILTRKLDPEAARMISVRFEREVRAVARLNHRNIVQVYDFGTEGDLAYIVMEHIQGKELKDYFDANERFDLKKAFGLMIDGLMALGASQQLSFQLAFAVYLGCGVSSYIFFLVASGHNPQSDST